MEQETSAEKQIPEGTIYKDKAMWVGTAIGGPLVTGYLAAHNYRVFGEKDKVWKTWLIAIAVTMLIFSMAIYAPYADRIPGSLFALVYTGIAYLVVRIWQGAKISVHIRAGGRIFSWYRVIGVSLIGAVLTAIPFFTFALLSGEFSETSKTYGSRRHEIVFLKNNISEAEVDKIADAFTKRDFFGNEAKTYLYVKKDGNTYEIFFVFDKSIKSDQRAIDYYTDLQKEIQELLPENKIVFVLTMGNIDSVEKRIE